MQMLWNAQRVHRVDHRTPTHDVSPGVQRGQVGFQPVGCHAAIGIRRHDDAVGLGERGRIIHGHAPCMAGIGLGLRKTMLQQVDPAGQGGAQRADEFGRAVGAVVDQQHDLGTVPALLQRQRTQAVADQGHLVANGDGYDDVRFCHYRIKVSFRNKGQQSRGQQSPPAWVSTLLH